jgi:hypothetical protein
LIQQSEYLNYEQTSGIVIGGIIGVSCALALVSFAYDNYNTDGVNFHQPLSNRDEKYRLELIGKDSVYKFFVGKSYCGLLIVVVTTAAGFWLLFIFVEGSEMDLSNDKVDFVYTWKCTRDSEKCFSTKDLNWEGWLGFAVLVGAHLLKDVINGLRMIILSAKQRYNHDDRLRFFVGGTILTTITLFTFYVSTIYNKAIATSEYYSTVFCTFLGS